MAKYLSEDGLSHLWTNILKPLFSSKVDKVAGKGLSSLDFTQAYLNRIGAAEDAVTTLGSTKVDKIGGKGLSANDFTNEYKNRVDQNATSISTLGTSKVDKVTGKGLSTNDFTTVYKDKVDQNAADVVAAMRATLLWTNASQGSTFAAQSIGGAWSAYTAFIVEYFVHPAQVGHRCIVLIPKGVEMSPSHYLGAFTSNYWRYIVINDGGVYFYDGYYCADGGAATVDNMKMIPYKIWGLKGVTL